MYLRALKRWTPFVAGAMLLALASGCSKSTTNPTPVLTTDTFTGTLGVLGTSSQSFTVNYALSASDASVTVTAMATAAAGTPVTTTIGIGFGSIQFDGSCLRSTTYSANAAAINQELTASGVFANGTYCAQIYDSGTLTEPVKYTFIVKHY